MKIALDAGHGFSNVANGEYDPGAVGGSLEEADITLSWALTGKWVLTRAGISVWLSRDSDTDAAPLTARDEAASAAGCTHFVSLHCNAASSNASGTECFYRDARDQDWAASLLETAVTTLRLPNRGVKPDTASPPGRLAVLDFAGPAALLELGFITNATDRALLTARASRVAFWTRVAAMLNA